MAKISLFSEIILGLDIVWNSILDLPTRYIFLNACLVRNQFIAVYVTYLGAVFRCIFTSEKKWCAFSFTKNS